MSSAEELYPGLDAEFSRYLRARAVSREIAIERGYKLVRQGKPIDGGYAACWGFPRKSSGMLIPLHGLLDDDATGLGSVQLRLDADVLALNPKWPKFRTPRAQPNVLATSPRTRHLLREDQQVIFIGEGVTRIDALAPFDVPGVATTGVWSWRSEDTSITDLRELKVKDNKFVATPDGDVDTNPSVFRAVQHLAQHLDKRGAASVQVLKLPDGQGLDDFIAGSGFKTREELLTAIHKYCVTFDELQAPRVSEREAAELFADDWQETYRYDQEVGLWRRWDGEAGRWGEAQHRINVEVGAHMERLRAKGQVTVDQVSKSKIHAVRDLAADFAVQQFDPDPDVLALPWNDLLNTETGETETLTREHYITNYMPDAIAQPPDNLDVWRTDWGSFVLDCLLFYPEPERMGVATYIQQWVGTALTTNTSDESALYLVGPTRTGKGTFLETLLAMMGDLGWMVAGNRVVGEQHHHSQWRARLSGKRLVGIDEVPTGRWHDDELHPLISGGTIEANAMRTDSIIFTSVGHYIFTSNTRPTSRGASGIWRRLRFIEFQNQVSEEAEDPHLKRKFEGSLSDVFAWAVAGHRAWLNSNRELVTPPVLRESTETYRNESDPYQDFVREELGVEPGAKLPFGQLYDVFKTWWDQNNSTRAPAKNTMSRALTDLGIASGSDKLGNKAKLDVVLRQGRMG